jgi:hypothetical protein
MTPKKAPDVCSLYAILAAFGAEISSGIRASATGSAARGSAFDVTVAASSAKRRSGIRAWFPRRSGAADRTTVAGHNG